MSYRILFLLALSCAACSSSSSDAPVVDTGTDVDEPKAPASSCVQPGDEGNSVGVGTPCTKLGHECGKFPGAPVCLADVGQDQWMCTRIGCTKDSECGSGATCFMDPGGSACVPNRCLDSSDAGSDSSTSETGGDASSDSGTSSDAASEGG